MVHAVLDESCIRRPVGGVAVMGAQLDHLMAYAESAQQRHLERDSGAVQPTLTAYYQLQPLALSQAESVALINRTREELP